jgi:pathogenesis-related protein 1
MRIRNLILLVLFGVSLNATTPTKTNVTELYVATFNRAPDSAGLNYWVTISKMPLEDIASSFFDQDETKALYGSVSDIDSFIVSIYDNLFKRDPDAKGADYWSKRLNSGDIKSSEFILAVVNGAKDDDKLILDNKTEVGLEFANKGLSKVDEAKDIMRDITALEQSKIDAINKLNPKKDTVKPVDTKTDTNATSPAETNTTKDTKTDTNTQSAEATSVLTKHNEIRAELFTDAPMSWSDKISKSAQAYADILGAKGVMEHDANNKIYGENLAISSASLSYTKSTDMWYEEKVDYSYDNGCTKGKVCGHYTQIIWKNSTELGCGSSEIKTGRFEGGTIVVCRYSPSGNYINQKPY